MSAAMGWAAGYFMVGLLCLAYLVAEDLKNGRRVQARDIGVIAAWPLFIFVCLIIGAAVYSDMTSKDPESDILGKIARAVE